MTKIVFYRIKDNFKGFEVKGHTGFSEEGKDILCAAISTATQMVVYAIKEKLNLKPELEIKDGYLKIILNDEDFLKSEVCILMDTCFDVLKQISKNKNKYIKLEVKENV